MRAARAHRAGSIQQRRSARREFPACAARLSSSSFRKAAGSWYRTSSSDALAVITPFGLKPGGMVSRWMSVRISSPAAASSTTVSATSPAINPCRRRTLPPPMTRTAADRGPQIELPRGERRQHAEQDAGRERQGKRKAQDAAVERHVRHRAENVPAEAATARAAPRNPRLSCGSSHKREQQVFDPKLSLNLPARGAQRQPRGDLARAAQHAHQGQPGKVRAGNEQNESRRQHQGQHLRPQRIRLAFLQRHGVIGQSARRDCSS